MLTVSLEIKQTNRKQPNGQEKNTGKILSRPEKTTTKYELNGNVTAKAIGQVYVSDDSSQKINTCTW